METEKYLVEMRNIVKTFPGVKALKGVDLKVKYGEIHGVIGENGAGKSTLMKCLAGIYTPNSGEIIYEGKVLPRYNTREALNYGISMIHQELSPIPYRPIMENIWLGREPRNKFGLIDHAKLYDMTAELLGKIGMTENPKTLMKDLTVAKVQMIEIAKAVSFNSKIIIMDEPTSALAADEINSLYQIMLQLKSQGKSIIYISHKLDEIYRITDRVSVYRDGTYIGTEMTATLPLNTMIKMMVGREVNQLYPKIPCEIGRPALEVRNLSHRKYFKNVSFTVRKGEILGIAGLIGAGRTEVIETIFGIRQKSGGEIYKDGKKIEITNPMQAIHNKLAILTEDRRKTGIFPMLTVKLNILLANLPHYVQKSRILDLNEMAHDCKSYIRKIEIKTPSDQQWIQNLSGGNQQKVLVARWLLTEPDVLFLDEPTRGIDVGTKSEIHRLISLLAGAGKAVVMVSSELAEVMGMSDEIMVMHEGRVTALVKNTPELTQEELMEYATGQKTAV